MIRRWIIAGPCAHPITAVPMSLPNNKNNKAIVPLSSRLPAAKADRTTKYPHHVFSQNF